MKVQKKLFFHYYFDFDSGPFYCIDSVDANQTKTFLSKELNVASYFMALQLRSIFNNQFIKSIFFKSIFPSVVRGTSFTTVLLLLTKTSLNFVQVPGILDHSHLSK